jgi:ribulose-5-phosphate 4-epimerase/fuculose-1-phosphate aldolase
LNDQLASITHVGKVRRHYRQRACIAEKIVISPPFRAGYVDSQAGTYPAPWGGSSQQNELAGYVSRIQSFLTDPTYPAPWGGVVDFSQVPAVVVANHGPFTWGGDAFGAVETAVVLEEVSKMALNTLLLNNNVPHIQQVLLDKHYLRKHGANAYYGQGKAEK